MRDALFEKISINLGYFLFLFLFFLCITRNQQNLISVKNRTLLRFSAFLERLQKILRNLVPTEYGLPCGNFR